MTYCIGHCCSNFIILFDASCVDILHARLSCKYANVQSLSLATGRGVSCDSEIRLVLRSSSLEDRA